MAIAPTLGQNGSSSGWNVTFDPVSGNLMAGGRVVALSESELAALRAWVTSTAGLDSVGFDTASGTIKSEGVSVTLSQVENVAVRALLTDAITRTEADAAYADKATEDLAALAESTAVQAKNAVEALAEKAVTTEVDPVTGRSVFSAGEESARLVQQFKLNGHGTVRVAGIYGAAAFNAGGVTWRLKIELPVLSQKIRAVRIALVTNPSSSATVQIAVGMAATSAALNPGGFNYGSIGGGGQSFGTFVIPQKSATYPDEVWSDWLQVNPVARTDGGTRAMLHASVFHSAGAYIGVANNATNDAFFETIASPQLKYRTFVQNGDFTTSNQSAFAGVGAANSPVVAVEFLSDVDSRIYSIHHFTDSVGAGYGTSQVSRGVILDAAASINTSSDTIAPGMCCVAGEAPENTLRRIQQQLFAENAPYPDAIIFRPYSVNAAGSTWRMYPHIQSFVYMCLTKGILPILETGTYTTGGNETSRVSINSRVREVAAMYKLPVVECADLFDSSNAATYLSDGTHPNDAGQAIMVPRFVSAIQNAIAVL